MHIRIYIQMHTGTNTYTHMHACMHACMVYLVRIPAYAAHVLMYTYMCVGIWVFVHTHTHTHTHTRARRAHLGDTPELATKLGRRVNPAAILCDPALPRHALHHRRRPNVMALPEEVRPGWRRDNWARWNSPLDRPAGGHEKEQSQSVTHEPGRVATTLCLPDFADRGSALACI